MEKVFFGFLQYDGEYDEMSGKLIVFDVYTGKEVIKQYANKYTAKRGFERIVRKMMYNESFGSRPLGAVEKG